MADICTGNADIQDYIAWAEWLMQGKTQRRKMNCPFIDERIFIHKRKHAQHARQNKPRPHGDKNIVIRAGIQRAHNSAQHGKREHEIPNTQQQPRIGMGVIEICIHHAIGSGEQTNRTGAAPK